MTTERHKTTTNYASKDTISIKRGKTATHGYKMMTESHKTTKRHKIISKKYEMTKKRCKTTTTSHKMTHFCVSKILKVLAHLQKVMQHIISSLSAWGSCS